MGLIWIETLASLNSAVELKAITMLDSDHLSPRSKLFGNFKPWSLRKCHFAVLLTGHCYTYE